MLKKNDSNERPKGELLNKLRAAVLGANDGIVSTSALLTGVAGATQNVHTIITAGFAALAAGACSMAIGEYVSVSSQSDALKAHLTDDEWEKEKSDNSPIHAAVSSFFAFLAGGLVPFMTCVLVQGDLRVPMTVVATIIGLAGTGYLSANVAGASRTRAIVRVIVGGVVAMIITYTVGRIFGVATA